MVVKRAFVAASMLAFLTGGAAVAEQGTVNILTVAPRDATTVTNYYKQPVYDQSNSKIGDVSDLLVQKDGKITAAMVGVGGVLGIAEKDVAVPFDALQVKAKDNEVYLVINTTKDALKSAPGFKYDRASATWVAEGSSRATRTQ